MYSRTEGEESGEDSYKLTMLDKVLISTVWIVGCINTLLSEYMVSKNPHTLCSIRDDLSSNLVIRDDINQSDHQGLPFCCYFS